MTLGPAGLLLRGADGELLVLECHDGALRGGKAPGNRGKRKRGMNGEKIRSPKPRNEKGPP